MEKVGLSTTALSEEKSVEARDDIDWFVWDEEMERYMADILQILCAENE